MTAGILHSENPAQENLVCMWLVDVSGQIFLYQTGRLTRVSSRGNRSVMVLYDYDSNAIPTERLKNNTTSELVRAQMWITQYLLDCGLNTKALLIDNKCPEDLKSFYRANSTEFQLCPPNDHRKNQAEKAIDSCK